MYWFTFTFHISVTQLRVDFLSNTVLSSIQRLGAVSTSSFCSSSTSLAAGSPSTPIEPVSVHRTVLSVAISLVCRLSIALFPSILLSDTSPRPILCSSAASFTTAAPGPVGRPIAVYWTALRVATPAIVCLSSTTLPPMPRFVAESISIASSPTTSPAAGSPLCPAAPVAVKRTVREAGQFSSTGLSLGKPGQSTVLAPVLRRRALALPISGPELSILSNAGLGAGGPGPPPPPLPVNPVTAEIILRGSLTSRTLRTPRLLIVGVEIELSGAVQTLGGVL